MSRLIWGLLLMKNSIIFIITAILVVSCQQSKSNIEQVKEYQEAANQHNIEGILVMFSDSARLDFGPMGIIQSKNQIRDIHEYDRALNTVIHFEQLREEENRVHCKIIETNNWLNIAGINRLLFTDAVFIFDNDGLIQTLKATLSPESSDSLLKALNNFDIWARENSADKYAQLFQNDSSFTYSYENGKKVLELLRQWQNKQ